MYRQLRLNKKFKWHEAHKVTFWDHLGHETSHSDVLYRTNDNDLIMKIPASILDDTELTELTGSECLVSTEAEEVRHPTPDDRPSEFNEQVTVRKTQNTGDHIIVYVLDLLQDG